MTEKAVSEALDKIFAADVSEEVEPIGEEQEISAANNELLDDIANHLNTDGGINVMWKITGINCSAHTIQLAVNDGLKLLKKSHQNIIALCRYVTKHLRLQSTINELNGLKLICPRLDVATRWSSTYLMVSVK